MTIFSLNILWCESENVELRYFPFLLIFPLPYYTISGRSIWTEILKLLTIKYFGVLLVAGSLTISLSEYHLLSHPLFCISRIARRESQLQCWATCTYYSPKGPKVPGQRFAIQFIESTFLSDYLHTLGKTKNKWDLLR